MRVPANLVGSVLSVVGLEIPSSFEGEKTEAGVRYSVHIEVAAYKILQIANRCSLVEVFLRPISGGCEEVMSFGDIVLLAFRCPGKNILFRLKFEYFIFNGKDPLILSDGLEINPEEVSISLEDMTIDITKVFRKYEKESLHLDEKRGRWYIHCYHKKY